MSDMETAAERLIKLVRSQGLVRPRDLAPHGIPRVSLTRAVNRGDLERIGRRLYGLPDRSISDTEHLPRSLAGFQRAWFVFSPRFAFTVIERSVRSRAFAIADGDVAPCGGVPC